MLNKMLFNKTITKHPLFITKPFYSHLDGVAVGQRVHTHGTGVLTAEKGRPDLVLWVGVVDAKVLDPRRETLVQPQVGPPLHGDLHGSFTQVTRTSHD